MNDHFETSPIEEQLPLLKPDSRTLRQAGELEAIRRLAPLLPSRSDVVTGIGDDAAVVRQDVGDWDLLLTSDAVLEGAHFLADDEPELIGNKVVGRPLSDIAAMGGEPLWALVDVVATDETPLDRLEAIYRGVSARAGRVGLAVIGGDVARGSSLELHAFVVGRVPQGKAVLRSGAKEGDLIYVTGTLGGSDSGKHLAFDPRIREGLWLRDHTWPQAMIDLSDGLSTDLRHLIEASGVGAEIETNHIPIAESVLAKPDHRPSVERAFSDGEDYELLFTVAEARAAEFERAWAKAFQLSCTRIGRITDDRGIITCVDAQGHSHPLNVAGFEHFKDNVS